MKLLFDENLSFRLVKLLEDEAATFLPLSGT